MLIGGPSFWFDDIGGLPPPRPPLAGPTTTDVVIVGGGFTGLWTAFYLKTAHPELGVTLLESAVCGFGASGRNGGWVSGDVPGYNDDASRQAAHETVREIGRVCEAEQIDCGYHRGGSLSIATNEPQLQDLRRIALGDDAVWLDPNALAERLQGTPALGAIYSPHYARIQPARLARGLVSVVERLGAVIHEQTPVREIAAGVARTDRGDAHASWVVRATEGYTASLRGLQRVVVPARSTMIVTERLPVEAWEQIGWHNAELVHDYAHAYVYCQRTADGRIAIGGRGRPYYFGSGHDQFGEVENWAIDSLTRRLHSLFPVTRSYAVAHAWSGVFGALRDWKMRIAADPSTGLATAGGYVGSGVAAANLSGRVLADLIRGHQTPLTRLPCVNRPEPRLWEPEPLRFAGANVIYWLLRQADRDEQRSGRRSRLRDTAAALGGWTHR